MCHCIKIHTVCPIVWSKHNCVDLCPIVCIHTSAHCVCVCLPAARHQSNPFSSTLITWFLYNGLAGWNESLCPPQEKPSCSDLSLIQQLYRELHTLTFISIQISPTVRATEGAAHTQWEQHLFRLQSKRRLHSTVNPSHIITTDNSLDTWAQRQMNIWQSKCFMNISLTAQVFRY